MATSFPASLDTFINPTAADDLDSATVPHDEQHANANDSIEALEAKVGIDSSADTDSHDFKIAAVESSLAGKQALDDLDTAGNAASVEGAVMRGEIASAAVVTQETTTSLSFTDLATSGPAPAATIGASGKALVILTGYAKASAINGAAVMGFAVSGASTVAASFDQALRQQSSTADAEISVTAMFLVTGLAEGSNTFTAKYASSTSSTASFRRRSIVVIPL